MSLQRDHAQNNSGSVAFAGATIEPLTNPNLFFEFRAIDIALCQLEKLSPSRISVISTIPGLSDG
ncbi:hypothetical protein LguiA_007435 [Lonicera macranthoides]